MSAVGWPLDRLPYRWVSLPATARSEANYLKALKAGDIAYLWAGTSISTHHEARARGAIIVQEALNSRMEYARKILDAEYDALGLPIDHGITQDRIDHQNERYRLSDAVFCPSPLTEIAMAGLDAPIRQLPTSYGVRYRADETWERSARDTVVFIFVGLGGIRKGLPRILEAWKDLPANYQLQIVGGMEPIVKKRYWSVLEQSNVAFLGFRSDVPDLMRNADVFLFPSLEEGGPQVTYEAANAGLPIIATPAGGGRFAEVGRTVVEIEPGSAHSIREAVLTLGSMREDRLNRARLGREIAREFDWNRVAAKRAALLDDLHVELTPTGQQRTNLSGIAALPA